MAIEVSISFFIFADLLCLRGLRFIAAGLQRNLERTTEELGASFGEAYQVRIYQLNN